MTDTTKSENKTIYFLTDTIAFRVSEIAGAPGITARPGMVLELTPEILELNPWLRLADDEPEQIRSYGRRLFGAGPVPEELRARVATEAEAEAREAHFALNRDLATFGRGGR